MTTRDEVWAQNRERVNEYLALLGPNFGLALAGRLDEAAKDLEMCERQKSRDLRACRSLTRCLDLAVGLTALVDDPGLEGYESDRRGGGRRDNNAACFEQSPGLQESAVHGSPATAEQHGKGFGGQVDP